MSTPNPAEINKANWDARATVHGQDRYYDSDALRRGTDSLTDVEWAGVRHAVGQVNGLDVLHVQCHLAFDAITLARHGARVTAVDFSPVALAKARTLADECGVHVEFVEADATKLPETLHGRFDLAYATIGILSWIGDVEAWMRSVAATLRPGGRLLLIDGHPLAGMVDQTDPLVLDFPYAYDGPHVFEVAGSYADRGANITASTTVQFAHSLGEVVTAAFTAGLQVVRLDEHLSSPVDMRGESAPDPDGRFRLRLGGQEVPLLFTLVAARAPGR